MRKSLSLLAYLGILTAFAQHKSQLGRYEIDYARACAPVTIHITSTDDFGNVSRQYFYEPDMVETLDTFHTYTTPGIYEIVQVIGRDVSPKTDTLVFEVTESPNPEFDIYQCAANAIAVETRSSFYDQLLVVFDGQDTVYIPGNDGLITYNFGQNSGQVYVRGILNAAFTTCDDTSISLNLPRENTLEINQIETLPGCLDQNFFNLQTASFNPYGKYQIIYQENSLPADTLFTGFLASRLQLPLPQGATGNGCISLAVLNECDQTHQVLLDTCLTLPTTTESLLSSYATYQGSRILINIPELNTSRQIQVDRSTTNTFHPLQTVRSSFLDAPPSYLKQYFYKLTLQDTCSNRLDSVLVAPPTLKLTDRSYEGNEVNIDWKTPQNNLGDFETSVLCYNADSTETITRPLTSAFEIPNGLGEIVNLRVRYQYDQEDVYSNAVSSNYETIVFVPKAFSPDGNGLNDWLELFGLPTTDFVFSIYDRWGKVIHQSSANPVWNGRIGKDLVASGTYLYQLRFKLESGELKTQVGTFALIRN